MASGLLKIVVLILSISCAPGQSPDQIVELLYAHPGECKDPPDGGVWAPQLDCGGKQCNFPNQWCSAKNSESGNPQLSCVGLPGPCRDAVQQGTTGGSTDTGATGGTETTAVTEPSETAATSEATTQSTQTEQSSSRPASQFTRPMTSATTAAATTRPRVMVSVPLMGGVGINMIHPLNKNSQVPADAMQIMPSSMINVGRNTGSGRGCACRGKRKRRSIGLRRIAFLLKMSKWQ